MIAEDFETPKRVWINCPSKNYPLYKFHGKVGIGTLRVHKTGYKEVVLYFTEGEITSMSINPLYLDLK